MRLIEYDYVRATAMMFVIFLHVLYFVDFSVGGEAYVIIDNTLKTLFFSCNALFFMLSGKFAVRLKKNYGEYLYKKIITLGIPIIICFVIRTYIQGGVC